MTQRRNIERDLDPKGILFASDWHQSSQLWSQTVPVVFKGRSIYNHMMNWRPANKHRPVFMITAAVLQIFSIQCILGKCHLYIILRTVKPVSDLCIGIVYFLSLQVEATRHKTTVQLQWGAVIWLSLWHEKLCNPCDVSLKADGLLCFFYYYYLES